MLKDLKMIDNAKYISDLFDYLKSEKDVPVSLSKDGQLFFNQMIVIDGENDGEYCIKLIGTEFLPESLNEIEIKLFYNGSFIKFDTYIREYDEKNSYVIKKPAAIFSSFDRGETRYKIKEDDQVVVYIPEIEDRIKLIDLSTKGLSLIVKKRLFKKDHIIKNISLKIEDNVEVSVDAVVKNIRSIDGDQGSIILGLELLEMDWLLYRKLYNYLFTKTCADNSDINDFLFVKYISSLHVRD